MSFFGKIGHAIGKGVHAVGGLAEKAAPFVGMIPGVGTLAGGALGGLGALAHGDGFGGALKYGAEGALSGYGGGLLKGTGAGQSFLGKVGSTLGQTAKNAAGSFMTPNGGLDIGKLVGAGGAISSLVGQSKQRHSAENYNNAMIQDRNNLMGQIMGPQNYNLPSIDWRTGQPTGGPQITPKQIPDKSAALTQSGTSY